jgi:hypothetical protein
VETVGLNSRDEETVSERETRNAKKKFERMSPLEVFEKTWGTVKVRDPSPTPVRCSLYRHHLPKNHRKIFTFLRWFVYYKKKSVIMSGLCPVLILPDLGCSHLTRKCLCTIRIGYSSTDGPGEWLHTTYRPEVQPPRTGRSLGMFIDPSIQREPVIREKLHRD